MLRKFLSVLLLCWLCVVHSLSSAATVLSFDHVQNTTLAGQWQFQPNAIVAPFQLEQQKSQYVDLPSSFMAITGQTNTLGTFEKEFILPKSALNHNIYIYAPYQYGAYRLYVNGHLLIQVGQVGNASQHQTEMAPKLASFLATQQQLTITMQVSSFQHINGGLENEILIGFNEPILDTFYGEIIPLSVVSGVLLMIGSFMVFFALFRRLKTQSGSALLFLGLFILCLSLRSFFAVPFVYTLFTQISWLWGTRFEYLLTELACLFFLSYIYVLHQHLLNRYLFQFTGLLILINVICTLFTQPVFFQSLFFKSFSIAGLVFANFIYAAYLIYKSKMPYSKMNLAAVILVCLTFVHDYLLALKLINSVEIAFYTSCLYFILITFQLSRDYALQTMRTELLNQELMRWNKELDHKVKQRTEAISLLNQQLAEQLRLDSLTGIYNRFALNEYIQQQYQVARDRRKTLAFYMIDVDFFKRYNDHYGHLHGDFVLKAIVGCIQRILPAQAFFARYGGEEFAIVLDDIGYEEACDFAEQVCAAVRAQKIEHANREDGQTYITISLGGAVMMSKYDYRHLHHLMKKADQQLYIAKKQRNTAVIV